MSELCEFSQFIDVFIACSWNDYRCDSGQCIRQYRRCDGILYDCYDGSDERYCATSTTARTTTRSITTSSTGYWFYIHLLNSTL